MESGWIQNWVKNDYDWYDHGRACSEGKVGKNQFPWVKNGDVIGLKYITEVRKYVSEEWTRAQ